MVNPWWPGNDVGEYKFIINNLSESEEKLIWFIMKVCSWSGDLDDKSLPVSSGPHSIERKIKFVIYLIPVTLMVTNHPLRFKFKSQPIRELCQDRPTNGRSVCMIRITHISHCWVNWDIMKVKFLSWPSGVTGWEDSHIARWQILIIMIIIWSDDVVVLV